MAWRIELFDEAAEAEIAYAVAIEDQMDAVAALRPLCGGEEIFVTARELDVEEVASLDLKPGEVRRV